MLTQLIKSDIGAKIRAARKAAGLTQLQLMRETGYEGANGKSIISNIETGKVKPSMAMLEKITTALGCEINLN